MRLLLAALGWVLGLGIWGLRSGIWDRMSEIRGWRPCLGFEVRDLGFGVGVLGSGVWVWNLAFWFGV